VETPWARWSTEYLLMDYLHDQYVEGSWGTMVQPEYGNTNEFHMLMGLGTKFNVFKIRFVYEMGEPEDGEETGYQTWASG
jgi:hypothetical protein